MNKLLTLLKPNALYLKGYAVPILFSLTLFVQVVLFQWFCYHNILITSLWKAPAHFAVFFRFPLSLASSSPVFACRRRKWWTVAMARVSPVDLLPQTCKSTILAVGKGGRSNLNGFQSSIRALLDLPFPPPFVLSLFFSFGGLFF